MQVPELHFDGLGASGQAATAQERRRLGRATDHPTPGARVVHRTEQRRARIAHHAAEESQPAGHRFGDAAGDHSGQMIEALAHQVVGRDVLWHRHRRDGFRGRVALQVVDLGEHGGRTDAIGDGVAQVQQGGSLAALKAFDQGGRPERPGDVQRRLQHHLGQIKNVAQSAGLGHPDPAHVKVEVEVGIDNPAGRTGGQGRHDDLLAQPQHFAGGILESGLETFPVRRAVENLQGHDPRPGPRVGFTAMHEQVKGTEFGRRSRYARRAAHRYLLCEPGHLAAPPR